MKPTAYDATTKEKYDNNGKGWYFRFDEDNKMRSKYIHSINQTWMGQFNTYKPTYCDENNEGNWEN